MSKVEELEVRERSKWEAVEVRWEAQVGGREEPAGCQLSSYMGER